MARYDAMKKEIIQLIKSGVRHRFDMVPLIKSPYNENAKGGKSKRVSSVLQRMVKDGQIRFGGEAVGYLLPGETAGQIILQQMAKL